MKILFLLLVIAFSSVSFAKCNLYFENIKGAVHQSAKKFIEEERGYDLTNPNSEERIDIRIRFHEKAKRINHLKLTKHFVMMKHVESGFDLRLNEAKEKKNNATITMKIAMAEMKIAKTVNEYAQAKKALEASRLPGQEKMNRFDRFISKTLPTCDDFYGN